MFSFAVSSTLAAFLAVGSPSPSPSAVLRPGVVRAAPVRGTQPLSPNLALLLGARPAPALAPLAPRKARAPRSANCPPASFHAGFEKDPFARGGVIRTSGPGASAFAWDGARRALTVHLDASRPAGRVAFPLGRTVTGGDCFRFGAVFTLDALVASPEDFFQLAFGLSNAATTGLNRTGTTPAFGDADTFDQVEVSYYPNETFFGGPFLSPSVFGGETPFGDAFANFTSVFGPAADLADNPAPQVKRLPLGVRLLAEVRHDPGTQLLTLSLIDLSGARPSVLETALVPLDAAFVNGTRTFAVDEFSLSSYFDAADFDPSTNSLVGDVAFHEIFFETCCD